MMKRNVTLIAGLLIALTTQGASADQIDGAWCSPDGKSVTINGRNVVTSRGTAVDANYDRHHIDFIVPAGEPDEGGQFRADQLNDNQIRVILIEANGKQKGEPEIWTPCKPVS